MGSISNFVKNSRAHVLEISNRASVQKLTLTEVAGITASLENHYSGLNTNAHQIGNIAGLEATLNDKASTTSLALKADAFTGYNGTLTIVTGVNAGATIVSTADLIIENGIITEII